MDTDEAPEADAKRAESRVGACKEGEKAAEKGAATPDPSTTPAAGATTPTAAGATGDEPLVNGGQEECKRTTEQPPCQTDTPVSPMFNVLIGYVVFVGVRM